MLRKAEWQYPLCLLLSQNTITRLSTYGDDVTLGKQANEYDYEVELGCGHREKMQTCFKRDALDHVLGYCVANDLSCRDLSLKHPNGSLEKAWIVFCQLGQIYYHCR